MKSAETARIALLGDEIVHSFGEEELWRQPVADLRVLGEYTTQSGPAGDDHFIVLVTAAADSWYEVSFDIEGAEELLASLSRRLGGRFAPSLSNSTDFKSVVMWPPALAGGPVFEFRREGLLGWLGLTNRQYLHPAVLEHIGVDDRSRTGSASTRPSGD